MLSVLLERMVREGSLHVEVLLLNEGRLAEMVRGLGIGVHVICEEQYSFGGLLWAVRRWMADRDFDVIHAHRYKEIIITVLSMVPRVRRLVVTVHGLEPRSQLSTRERLIAWGPIVLARLYGARFVGVSEEIAGRLTKWVGKSRVVKIPNPMPPIKGGESVDIRARFGWAADRPVVGFIGRLEEIKGPDYFLEVASRSREDAGFIVIGTGSMKVELLTRVRSDGLGDRVGFLGEVPDAVGYLRQLDVLAVTSRHEGLPMVLLEAAACEVPVVAFDVGGVRDVLDSGPAARLVPAGDAESFRKAVDEIVRDRDRARMAATSWARSVQARFNVSRTVSSYLALYNGNTPPAEVFAEYTGPTGS
jgi:glycosyltransferase involved in cell wall biosynthesis